MHFVSSLNIAGGVGSLLLGLSKLANKQNLAFEFVSLNPQLDGHCYHEFEQLGCSVKHILPPSKVGILKFKHNIESYLVENGPYDAVHSHMLHLNGVVLKAAHSIGIKKRVSHSHSASYENARSKSLAHSLYNNILKNINSFYATDRLSCSKIAGQFLYQKRVLFPKGFTVFKNSINISEYQGLALSEKDKLRDELGITNTDIVIGCVARLVKIKNHIYLLRVFKELISHLPNAKLLLIGTGSEIIVIQKEIEKLKLTNGVILAGIRNDVPRVMQIMDVFVLTSIAEGLGMVVVEAQTAGLACVVSKAIPAEADLGCGLVRRLNLDDNVVIWSNAIVDAINLPNMDISFIHNSAYNKGYDLNKAIHDLELIYRS